jgi:hypothetical protein
MCDYSLELYQSRPAQEGEKYQTRQFSSGSIGFVAPGKNDVAICMACDMRLRLTNIPERVQEQYGLRSSEDVTFIHLDTGTYRDGVRFDSGTEVTLQRLGPGVEAVVIDALTGKAMTSEIMEMA